MIKKVSIIGTGVIGLGWIVRCLAHNKKVTAFDKDIKLKKKLIVEIKRAWPYVKKLFNKNKLNLKNFKFVTTIEEAVKTADFIQECAPENYTLKIKLVNTIGKFSKSKKNCPRQKEQHNDTRCSQESVRNRNARRGVGLL